MLRLVGSNVRDGCKDITAMGSRALDAVPVIDTAFASLLVHIEVPEIVIKVYRAGAEVAAEQGGMGSKDGRDVDMTLAAKGDRDSGEPFVKVGNDGGLGLVVDKLLFTPTERGG